VLVFLVYQKDIDRIRREVEIRYGQAQTLKRELQVFTPRMSLSTSRNACICRSRLLESSYNRAFVMALRSQHGNACQQRQFIGSKLAYLSESENGKAANHADFAQHDEHSQSSERSACRTWH